MTLTTASSQPPPIAWQFCVLDASTGWSWSTTPIPWACPPTSWSELVKS
jgi:hypothetical protein